MSKPPTMGWYDLRDSRDNTPAKLRDAYDIVKTLMSVIGDNPDHRVFLNSTGSPYISVRTAVEDYATNAAFVASIVWVINNWQTVQEVDAAEASSIASTVS